MCQYKDGLLNQLEVDKMLSSLAEDMESSLNYHIQIINNSNQVRKTSLYYQNSLHNLILTYTFV